ncbi:MAG: riboflavin kinase, partial [Clostridia bacterium]
EGVYGVVDAQFDDKFMNLSKETFLDGLVNTMNITRIICGKDYTFGQKASGDTQFLKEYFKKRKIAVEVVELVQIDGVKASTTYAKELLKNGEIEKLNKLLVKPYRVSGIVKKGNQIGATIGFPTANIEVPTGQTRIKQGVYAGYATVLGKRYKAIINAGARPTLNSEEYKIESFIDGEFGELYGAHIVVEFIFKIRDIQKFESLEKLKEQLRKDIKEMEKLE